MSDLQKPMDGTEQPDILFVTEQEGQECPEQEAKSQSDIRKEIGKYILEIAEVMIAALLIVGFLFCCFFRTAGVDGDSMEDTLQNGDHLLIYHFFYTPQRGDVVIVNRYQADDLRVELPLIKRVIAVEGDTVRVTTDAVYVNGEKLEEPYIHYPNNPSSENWLLYDENGQTLEEVTVPEGKIFVMGDHRNFSKDSRMLGFMDEDDVMGKAVLRLFPFDKFGIVE